MALEKPKKFVSEHKTEIVVGSVMTMLGAIGAIAAERMLDKLADDPEASQNTDDSSDSS